MCALCESEMNFNSIVNHVTGRKHKLQYLKRIDHKDYPRIRFLYGSSRKTELTNLIERACADSERLSGRGSPKIEISHLPPSTKDKDILPFTDDMKTWFTDDMKTLFTDDMKPL